ncbi:hypothetical protein O6H91_08G024700 [Diphasiastrum complanatum]|uniref:Uncharacterized protein n=1 Tax=Diphasiastrum complanatum TaxID=34168 RepID=A0ACC2CW13_DIPCM|nr:hypothetical protein O6H91_08G024700 [Diphasiastrum complanatum]
MRSLLQIALLLGFLALVGKSVAEEYIVGDRAGWRPRSVDYAQWSARNAFRAGDSLLFPYDQGAQSVMSVSKEDFHLCRTKNPIEHYTDGNTIVRLDRERYYFISGVPGHCNAGMKLEVILAGASPSGAPSSPPVAGPSPTVSSPTPPAPVPTPSAAPLTPPTTAPISSPTVAPPAPAPAVSTPVPSPAASPPAPPPYTPTPSQSPLASSSPPSFFTPAEGPGAPAPPNAATSLPSALARVLIAASIVAFSII